MNHMNDSPSVSRCADSAVERALFGIRNRDFAARNRDFAARTALILRPAPASLILHRKTDWAVRSHVLGRNNRVASH
jgi:hypothetical protein